MAVVAPTAALAPAPLGFTAARLIVIGKPDKLHIRVGGVRATAMLSASESSNLQTRGEVRLGLRVRVPADSKVGEVSVWETVNGVVSLGAVIHIDRTGRDPRIRWTTATIRGGENHVVNRYSFSINATNDPRPGVFRVGRNDLDVAVQAYTKANAAVTVLPGTRVRLLDADRPILKITGPESISNIRLGKVVTVPFALVCTHCPPNAVRASLKFDSTLAQAVGPSSIRMDANGRGSFSFRLLKRNIGGVEIDATIAGQRITAQPLVVTWIM
jgi:hypothetical protein